MSGARAQRGGAPVGFLAELGPVESGAVLCLRLWCDGPEGQARLWTAFARALDPEAGRHALRSFERLFSLWVGHSRRPLVRHDTGCSCIGGDEACFANFVAAASEGDREDAMLIASTVVRADMAMLMVTLAEDVGLALRRLPAPPATQPDHPPRPEGRLH